MRLNPFPRTGPHPLPWRPLGLMLLALLSLWGGCAQAGQTLRVGTNLWPGYEPLYLAQDIVQPGWDKAIRLVEYPSATEVLRAFRNRAIEAAGLTLDEALLLKQDGVPLRLVLVMDISQGADVIIARPEIPDMAGLRGKRVAVESGALGAYVLTRALELHGLGLDEIDIAHLDVSSHRQAFVSGQVDAVVTFEPVRTQLLNAGGREVFSSREIPGEVVDALVVHEDFLQRQPETVEQLIKGWFQALQLLQQRPDEAAGLIGKRLKLSPREVLDSYAGLYLPSPADNLKLIGGPTPDLLKTLHKLRQLMRERNLLGDDVDLSQLLSADSLPVK
ncbi:MAG: ABC transporter substrate-binding protein [Gammaproteobacteria bacterium SHHR-1]|uniref:ABC transporter substrate-binding protein n=1 Tax=Magnetovirga frankeli TaxID=947516 RepID=UPI001292FA0F|nr:ABC transporter substrate-binding protein [gamma proteobacterium SS-5]